MATVADKGLGAASTRESLGRGGDGWPTAMGSDLACRAIAGEAVPGDEMLGIICERIREAAQTLGLAGKDLEQIFRTYTLFEDYATAEFEGAEQRFLIVEAHHAIQGKVGKGALKIVVPADLVAAGRSFVTAGGGGAEVVPAVPIAGWRSAEAAWETVKAYLRDLITGETLSMSLKSQATGAPFAGSEGVILCALGDYQEATGRFFLRPVLACPEAQTERDKELLEAVMNSAAEVLTRAGRIAHDRIVHAAETNSTRTSRLKLQLPTNVVEGHLRALLHDDPGIVIGDEDMTVRLRRLLARADYRPTACALAREAARLQLEHSILLPVTRERLRTILGALALEGQPRPDQFQEIVGLFFGSGETQQTEDQIFHHRQPILRKLASALSAGRLDECADPAVLEFYLRVLLDNQVRMMKAALLERLPPEEALAVDWIERNPLFTPAQETELAARLPAATAGKAEVQRGFACVLDVLTGLLEALPEDPVERYSAARRAVVLGALRAITVGGEIIPSVDRIRFFAGPFTCESLTPKLGVVTRKPLEVCGSELRPQAMSAGAVHALELWMRARGAPKAKPFEGLTVAIQGLGNAGKGVARLLVDRGVRVVAVSDSRGAMIAPGGLNAAQLTALLSHKSAGKRLDSYPLSASANPELILHRNPDALMTVKADLLVLTAKAASLHRDNASGVMCKVVCELTGAAVTGEAKAELRRRSIQVIPDNVGSSGGLLVSLSEMLQNSYGQQWEKRLEDDALRHQIEQSYEAMGKLARRHEIDLAAASDLLALKRMHALAVYRENLEATARRLREEIRAIGPGETVLVASDDDDDGVASAAMFRALMAQLNPGCEQQALHLNESLRSRAILEAIEAKAAAGIAVQRVFVLDRAFPIEARGQQAVAELARRCSLVLINNHDLPDHLLGAEGRAAAKARQAQAKTPAELGIWLISPQTLRACLPARHFSTALLLRELVHQLVTDPLMLIRLDWQAAIGSCLDVSPETTDDWQLFYAQFNVDQMMEAARAVRMMAQARGCLNAIQAVEGVERPDQLETNKPWEAFVNAYGRLAERVQLLVGKIVVENVGRPYVAHLFTPAEVASPALPVGEETRYLDLYPWISEHLTKRADFSEKPIIVGQVIRDRRGRLHLGVRIRSPRGVELMEVGLPEAFRTGGLPNTAVARIPLDDRVTPEQQFQSMVEDIWWKTISPTVHLKKARSAAG